MRFHESCETIGSQQLVVTSTLIRYENEVFRKRKPEALKKPALFLQSGLPSTEIRLENGAFRRSFSKTLL